MYPARIFHRFDGCSLKLSKNRHENKCYSPENIPKTYSKIYSPNYSSISIRKKKQNWNLHESSNSTVARSDRRGRQTTKRKYFPPRFIIYAFPHHFRVRSRVAVLDTLNYCSGTCAPVTVLRIWLSDFAYSKVAGCVAARASISVEEENYCNYYPSLETNSLLLIYRIVF